MTEEEQIRFDLSKNLISKVHKLAADYADRCDTIGVKPIDILTDLGFIYHFLLANYCQTVNMSPNTAAASFFKFYNEKCQRREEEQKS